MRTNNMKTMKNNDNVTNENEKWNINNENEKYNIEKPMAKEEENITEEKRMLYK